jgi:L-alanine-DL-glutamate epimerase-like enolase superfamily enzyme
MYTTVERWPLTSPFRIASHEFNEVDVLFVSLEREGCVGRGEAAGIFYRSDTPGLMFQQAEALRVQIEYGITRRSLQQLLAPGGARNALDCALWDLEAKLTGVPAWQLAKLNPPRPLLTTFGCGADTPDSMAALARSYTGALALKLKLTGEFTDAERVRAVRAARSDVWLAIDANQSFTRAFLDQLMPVLVEARVSLIEQPFPAGKDAWLDDFESPIPIAADESVQGLADIPNLKGRYDVVNIKLDKCGGLTEALAMARAVRDCGLEAMVGNAIGTSLAMAPAFLVGQLCKVVDLDGPIFLKSDRTTTVQYMNGYLSCPTALWGHATNRSG